jgi:hypothetical protein
MEISQMEQWEYHILTAQSLDELDELDSNLARLGEASWVLAGIIPPLPAPPPVPPSPAVAGTFMFRPLSRRLIFKRR